MIEKEENILSKNLRKIHKRDRIFFSLEAFFVSTITATIVVILKKHPSPLGTAILYTVAMLILPLFVYLILRHGHKSFPKMIYYAPEGLYWITRGGKKVFVPWEDIIKVIPIGDYGRIMGYGNGKVSDYMLFFKRPFPGYTPVSAEVAEKIREYMAKYKN